MNVLIYNPPPPLPKVGSAYPPLLPIGVLIIGTYAKHAGHNVRVIDGNVSDSLEDIVRDGFAPDVLGISLPTMHGILYVDGLRNFISAVQKNADPILVFGGAGASVFPEVLLNEKLANYIVFGPGEEIFVDLLSALETGSPISAIPGIGYLDADGSYVETERTRRGGFGVSLQLDYSLMDISRYILLTNDNRKSIAFLASRGCKYRCTFCYNEFFNACSYQTRPVPVIISEMKYLIEHYGITYFYILDECFGSDKAWMRELCNAIIAELPPIIWFCQLHAGINTREDYELMNKAGCCYVCIGIESADPQMSRKIRKAIDLTRVPAEIDMLHELGFIVMTAFIVGFPDETREQLLRTCEFMLSCKADESYIGKFYLIPDTKIFDELESSGRIVRPKTLAEFQKFLSPKRYPNYSKIPTRDLNVVIAFFSLAYRMEFLNKDGVFRMLRNLLSYMKRHGMQKGGDKRFLFSSFGYYLQMFGSLFAHPFIRKQYGLWLRNYQRPSPSPCNEPTRTVQHT